MVAVVVCCAKFNELATPASSLLLPVLHATAGCIGLDDETTELQLGLEHRVPQPRSNNMRLRQVTGQNTLR